jgi:hypothetical protein
MWQLIFLILAIICFAIEASRKVPQIAFGWIGMMLFALSFLPLLK